MFNKSKYLPEEKKSVSRSFTVCFYFNTNLDKKKSGEFAAVSLSLVISRIFELITNNYTFIQSSSR